MSAEVGEMKKLSPSLFSAAAVDWSCAEPLWWPLFP
jgi:hypothetical protein